LAQRPLPSMIIATCCGTASSFFSSILCSQVGGTGSSQGFLTQTCDFDRRVRARLVLPAESLPMPLLQM
jgi:hypothetical protein